MIKNDSEVKVEYEERELVEDAVVSLDEIFQMIEVVASVPTDIPRKFSEQIKIYETGAAATRLYIYDNVNGAWKYATLT